MDFAVLVAFISAGLAILIAVWVAFTQKHSVPRRSFVVGMAVLSSEAILSGLSRDSFFPEQQVHWQGWSLIALALLPGIWLFFSLSYARGNYQESLRKWRFPLGLVLFLPPLLTFIFRGQIFVGLSSDDTGSLLFGLSPIGMGLYFFFLSGAIFILMNLERTYRAAVGTMRWRIKYMIIGLGLLFVVRGYTASQCILFHSLKSSLESVNFVALILACLLIVRSLFRAGYFEVNVYPSQAVIHHSITFFLAGIYLLVVGAFAKAVTIIGGTAAFPLKAFFVLVALVVLTLFLLSDRLRLSLRQFVSRHFQRPLHNYRTVWKRFTETTASCVEQTELCQTLVRLLSDIFQLHSVTIWTMDPDEKLRATASSFLEKRELPQLDDAEMTTLIHAIQLQTNPVDFDLSKESWGETLRKYHPTGFQNGGHRFCIPMSAGGHLQGLITLGDRVSGVPFSEQDIDLLKCAADQAAASILTLRLSQKLLQSKEMEAFQTMSTFFVHDLKNTASTLSLMLQNLSVHYHDPAFKEDAVRGISKSVAHINDLIKRLTLFRQEKDSGMVEADLNKLVQESITDLPLPVDIKIIQKLHLLPKHLFDPRQMEKVITNLVLNAKDAINGIGEIRVETGIQNGWAMLSVTDTGSGMTEEFVKESLFRPFQTTKKNGIGIGMFQCKTIVQSHGGKIEVSTQSGRGTTFRVFLPLAPEIK